MSQIMSLKELNAITNVYSTFKTISECSIPDYYKSHFPEKCDCGAEMIMTEPSHTQLQCCNTTCYVKMGHRLAYFVSSLGYKGFGEQSGISLMTACKDVLQYNSFLASFFLSDTELAKGLTDYYVGLFNEIRNSLRSNQFNFVEAISSLGIPGIGPKSNFFEVVKSPIVLLDAVLKDKTDFICDLCGIHAPMTRFYLSQAKLDIVLLMRDIMPNILETPKNEIYVAITGKVTVKGVPYSRFDFISLCESIRGENNEPLFKLIETKSESKIDYVIADQPSNSSKYKLGERLGKLITADDFYIMLNNKVK